MVEFYLEIRAVHIGSVMTSGTLFLLRGLALNLFGWRWALAWPLRYLSWTVDTVLLTAALMLMTIVHQYPVIDGWLTVKVVLLVVYIALGLTAFRGRSPGLRIGCWLAALAIYAFIYSVARAHDPLGLLGRFASA